MDWIPTGERLPETDVEVLVLERFQYEGLKPNIGQYAAVSTYHQSGQGWSTLSLQDGRGGFYPASAEAIPYWHPIPALPTLTPLLLYGHNPFFEYHPDYCDSCKQPYNRMACTCGLVFYVHPLHVGEFRPGTYVCPFCSAENVVTKG